MITKTDSNLEASIAFSRCTDKVNLYYFYSDFLFAALRFILFLTHARARYKIFISAHNSSRLHKLHNSLLAQYAVRHERWIHVRTD